jgi:hypothetical protein
MINTNLFFNKIIFIIFLTICSFSVKAQETTDSLFTFTEEEVIQLDSIIQFQEQTIKIQNQKIELLESQINNYKLLQEQDSLHITFLNQNVNLLNDRVNLYVDLNKELRPKWYKKPVLHFFLGAITVTTSAVVLNLVQ